MGRLDSSSAAKPIMRRLLLLLVVAFFATACGSGPNPKVETDRLESATKMRALFDKTGGDYQKLTAEDRAELMKMFDNNEANVKQSWQFMKDRGQTPTGG